LYPVIDFSAITGGQQTVYTDAKWYPKTLGTAITTLTSVYVPLDLTRSCYIAGITPIVQWEHDNDWFMNPNDNSYYQGMSFLTYGLNAYKYLKLSYRDLAPKWGISVSSRVTSTPFDNLQFNSIWYILGRLYLPGLLNHHSFQVSIGYQNQNPSRYMFSSRLPFPRGYIADRTHILTTFTSDYSFPIAYPDWAIGPFLYFKRIRGNLFYDFATNTYRNKTEKLSSIGFDLTSDFHFLRIIFPINAGVRMIYMPQLGQYSSQLLLSVDLSNY
jgi:hypothetical protein